MNTNQPAQIPPRRISKHALTAIIVILAVLVPFFLYAAFGNPRLLYSSDSSIDTYGRETIIEFQKTIGTYKGD